MKIRLIFTDESVSIVGILIPDLIDRAFDNFF